MQRVTILYDASQAVLSTFDLDEVLNQILQIARNYFRLQSGCILLLDEETQELYERASFGRIRGHSGNRVPMGKGLVGNAAQSKRPVYAPDVSKDSRYIEGSPSTKSELAVPLMVQDKVVGVLDCQSDELDHFDNETVDLLTLFAAQASIGLQNAKLYSLVQRRAAQMEALNALAKQTTVERDLKELLDSFCSQLPKSFPVEHVAVLLRDAEDVLELRARYSLSPIVLDEERVRRFMVDNAAPIGTEKPESRILLSSPPCFVGAHAEVFLPLVSFGQELGVLVCAASQHSRFQQNDLLTLESVADILATAVQNAEYVERVKQLAYRDGLTGIYNRRYFESKILEEISRHSRYGGTVAMLMFDIDHFKNVNDEFGHLLGDEVLKQVAQLLTRQLRKLDVVCRYGGEELAVILPSTQLSAAERVAEKLRQTIESFEFPGVPRPITVSVGVSEFPTHGCDRDQIVRAADAALYCAKQSGRNRIDVAAITKAAP